MSDQTPSPYGNPSGGSGAGRDVWGPPADEVGAAARRVSPAAADPAAGPPRDPGTPWWSQPAGPPDAPAPSWGAATPTGAAPAAGPTGAPTSLPTSAPTSAEWPTPYPAPVPSPAPFAPGGGTALLPAAPLGPWAPPPVPTGRRTAGPLRAVTVAALVAGLIGGGIGAGAVSLARDGRGGSSTATGASTTLTQVRDSGAASRPAGSVADIAQRVLPSVVTIKESSGTVQGTGSGVVIDKQNGYILTNNHVVADVSGGGGSLTVTPDGGRAGQDLAATVVGTDAATDLAVIKVPTSSLPAIELGKSSDVVVGDQVLAVGAPLGLSGTVTAGIVSALDRGQPIGSDSGGGSSVLTGAIQTDAAINPGNSGGALVDAKGRLIGINTAIASNTGGSGQAGNIGIGFAIPIDSAAPIAQQLIAGGKVTHPYIGVGTKESKNPAGARISSVNGQAVRPGSPAAAAGLREGDVITKVGSTAIGNQIDLIGAVRKQKVGDTVELTIVRDGTEQKVKVTLADNPSK